MNPTPEELMALVSYLDRLAEAQRHERGCAFYLGTPDPEIAQITAALKSLAEKG